MAPLILWSVLISTLVVMVKVVPKTGTMKQLDGKG